MPRPKKVAQPKQQGKDPREWTTQEIAERVLGKPIVKAAKRVAHEHDQPQSFS